MSNEESNNDLLPSELGTKEYWSSIYKRDVQNFMDHGDVGEIWFGEDSVLRIVRWLEKNVPKESFIVDLGCGNGMFLLELYREDYKNLSGFDYCEDAITLSSSVLQGQSIKNVELKVLDLTGDIQINNRFDVAIDKGTYDAVCLSPDSVIEKRAKYLFNISQILKSQGLFIITSCNWTEKELMQQFASDFIFYQSIPTPTFRFGGKEGTLVSTVIFKKKPND